MPRFWLCLQCCTEPARAASADDGLGLVAHAAPDELGLWALQFSPHVARREDAWLMDATSTLRLWGGAAALLAHVRRQWVGAVEAADPAQVGQGPAAAVRAVHSGHRQALKLALGPTPLAALAMARTRQWAPPDGVLPAPERLLALPLHTLSALRPWLAVWRRLGVKNWGHLDRLPRDGLAHRWGPQARLVLDQALGRLPDPMAPWVPPEAFDQQLAWDARVDHADGLLVPAQRLLGALAGWLTAHQRAATALRWTWRHDRLRNADPTGQLELQSAVPRADPAHWWLLTRERLGRCRLAAPVTALRLQTLSHQPWSPASDDWLHTGPSAATGASSWPVPDMEALTERLQARLGRGAVEHWRPGSSHWPEGLQHPQPGAARLAAGAVSSPSASRAEPPPGHRAAAPLPLQPTWCLAQPRPLRLQGNRPCHLGLLDLLAGPHRLEWAHWTGAGTSNQATRTAPSAWPGSDSDRSVTLRDYFVARSPGAGLLWVFRDPARGGWFLHGWFA